MYKNPSQQAYAQGQGIVPTNGTVIADRDPIASDVFYPIGQFWLNRPSKNLWYLDSQSNITSPSNPAGALQSTWQLISVSSVLASLSDTSNTVVFPSGSSATPPDNIQIVGGTGISVTAGSHLLTITNTSGAAETLTGDDGIAVSSSAGTIQTLGNTVANATHAKPLFTHNPSGNIEEWDIQVSSAIASTNINSTGLSAFSNAQFSVDSNGFVTLAGGTTAPVLGIIPDAHTVPGTSPVIPNGSGDIILEGGATFATGTQTNPIRTNSLAANTIDLQIQLAGSHASTSTANDFGVCQFDANQFSVTSGFVQLAGGTTAGVLTLTGNSGGAIGPDGSGNINTVGTGSITVVGSGHTLTAELTGLTAHNVLIGEGTATIGLAAPTATSGIPLISQGAAADPIFGTATVPGGGTGDTSFTAYSVICGGTTSTGNLQNVVGVGSANQVLTSNGAGALPTWQTNSVNALQINLDAGTSPISPSANVLTFTGAQVNSGVIGANVIRTDGNSSSGMTIQIQKSATAVSSTPADNGVCHFNQSEFTIDANGFVQSIPITINAGAGLTGGGMVNLGGSLTLAATGAGFGYSDQGISFSAASNSGYFVTASVTATLPGAPANSDIIKFIVDASATLIVQASGGKIIRVGGAVSSANGTATSDGVQGDALELVYRNTDGAWLAQTSMGSWILA